MSKRLVIRRSTAALLCVLVLSGTVLPLAVAQDTAVEAPKVALLHVCEDEATVERAIGAYIKTQHDVDADIREWPRIPGDVFLSYSLSPANAPRAQVTVDTYVSARKDGVVLERRVTIRTHFVLEDKFKTPEIRAKLLELNNEFMKGRWIPHRVYLDKDGDVCLESHLNIPGKDYPIHPELVHDLIYRTLLSWDAYYPELAKVIPLPPLKAKQAATPAAPAPAPAAEAAPGS
jgi:Putative bacterial sensory transduction regulator